MLINKVNSVARVIFDEHCPLMQYIGEYRGNVNNITVVKSLSSMP
jgi:hypothetical protein